MRTGWLLTNYPLKCTLINQHFLKGSFHLLGLLGSYLTQLLHQPPTIYRTDLIEHNPCMFTSKRKRYAARVIMRFGGHGGNHNGL